MKTKARARRQRIPAFGEWNYAAYVDGAADWPVTQYFESGVQAGQFVMAIPPPKPANKVVKWRESATLTLELEDEDEEDEKQQQRRQHVVVGAVKKQGNNKQQQSPVVVGYKQKQAGRVVAAAAVKAMDKDLYHIPPDMLCHEPRKRLTRRSLWMGGCLGLNCVA